MSSRPYTDEEVDFSKPLAPKPETNPETNIEGAPTEPNNLVPEATTLDPRITEIKSAKFTRKTLILIIVFTVLAVVQGILIYINIPKKSYPAPKPKTTTTKPKTTKPKTTTPKTTTPITPPVTNNPATSN